MLTPSFNLLFFFIFVKARSRSTIAFSSTKDKYPHQSHDQPYRNLSWTLTSKSIFQEAVLKANARTKKWIVYSVVFGSIAVMGVSGILVGLYLSGNLNREAAPEVG